MRIRSVQLENFGSYKGENNLFDFQTKTGRDGYAIFGDIGRGKTSMVNGILWGLYGHVSMRDMSAQRSRERPIIDAEAQKIRPQDATSGGQKEIPPILNTYSFQEGNYRVSVRIIFDHEGDDGKIREYSLLREAEPNRKKPQNDSHMNVLSYLTVEGKSIEAGKIQEKINEVMHEDISKFFFVEGDVIDNYAHLLFAKDIDHSIVEEVEIVLGLPALDKSEEDFKWLKEQMDDALVKALNKNKKAKTVANKIKKLNETITEKTGTINILNQQIEFNKQKEEKIEEELSGYSQISSSKQKLDGNKRMITGKSKSLEELYKKRKELLSEDLWKCLIQKGIGASLDILDSDIDEKEELVQKRAEERASLHMKENQIQSENVECPACGNEVGGKTEKEKEKLGEEISSLKALILERDKKIESIGNPHSARRRLEKFRSAPDYKYLEEIEQQISILMLDISELKKKNKKIEELISGSDSVHIADLMRERTSLVERGGSLKNILAQDKHEFDVAKEEKKKYVGKLNDFKDNDQTLEIKKLKETYEWLSNQFKNAMAEFKEEARKSVEEISTSGFLRLIPSPEKYSTVEIDSNWNVLVKDKKGREAWLTNPGHRQTLALAVFNGLRKTSKLQFPTFFDNPGSNIADVDKVADYFWEDDVGQMVMLSHGGGLKKNESMKKYGDRLARSWEITYPEDSDDLISVIEVVA